MKYGSHIRNKVSGFIVDVCEEFNLGEDVSFLSMQNFDKYAHIMEHEWTRDELVLTVVTIIRACAKLHVNTILTAENLCDIFRCNGMHVTSTQMNHKELSILVAMEWNLIWSCIKLPG